MAVSRSPFSKPTSNDWNTPWGIVTGESTPTVAGQKIVTSTVAPSGAPSNYATGGGLKTSVFQEQRDLESAVSSSLARIATGGSSDAARMTNDVMNISNGKGHTNSGGGLLGALKKIATVAIEGPLKVMEVSATVGRGIQSGIQELEDAVAIANQKVFGDTAINRFMFGTEERNVSFKDFVNQTTDKNWKLIHTGHKWLDGVLDFGVDVLTDPLTYAGVGVAKYAGRAGKIALATKFGTAEMRAKYPTLILEDILRIGEHAIPAEIRAAEGVKVGIRYAGRVIPKTEKLAAAVTGKYGIITGTKNAIGDMIYKLPNGPELLSSFAFKSTRPIVASGAFRRGGALLGVQTEHLVPLLAENTARRMARGATSVTFQKNLEGIRGLLKDIETAGVDSSKIVKMLDAATGNPEAYALRASATQQELDFAEKFAQWQRGLYDDVNAVYKKFGIDFNTNAQGLGFVDDYVHHKMTKEALNAIYNKNSAVAKLFNNADLSAQEIGGFVGAGAHRLYVAGEKFMGEELKYGSIDEINRIFANKMGRDVKFFEDDLASIADGYAYSLAKAKGRETYIRRLMDFDKNAVKILGKKTGVDQDLVAQLGKAHKVLVDARATLASSMDKRFGAAKLKADQVVKLAQDILSGKRAEAARNIAEVTRVQEKLRQSQFDLIDAMVSARGREAGVRAAFFDQHRVLMDEIATLHAAIQAGEEQSYVAVKQLQEHYMALFPDARNIPTDPKVLAERILNRQGVATSKELSALTKREKEILRTLEGMPKTDKEMIDALNNELKDVRNQIDGHSLLADVRVRADYAPDGLLYGDAGMLGPLVPDPNGAFEQPAFRYLDSAIIDPAAGGFDNPAWREQWLQHESSVAVHAIDPTDLVDMRDPEGYAWFFSPENVSHEAMGEAMTRAGLPEGQMFLEEYTHMIESNGQIDPMFEEMFPEMTDLLVFMWNADQVEFPTGVAGEDVVANVFANIKEMVTGVAARENYGTADITAKKVYDEFLGIMANRGAADHAGFVMPSRVIHGVDNTDAYGHFSVILNDQYDYTHGLRPEDMAGKPTSTVHFTSDKSNGFIQDIVNNDYETASLKATEKSAEITGSLIDAELGSVVREEMSSELRGVKRKIGSVKARATKQRKQIERSLELFSRSGEIEFSLDGGKTVTRMNRDKAVKLLSRKERQLSSKTTALEKRIEQMWDDATKSIYAKQTSYEQRIAMGLNKAKVLQNWNDTVGVQLERDIELMRTAIKEMPSKGATHDLNLKWLDRVQASIDSVGLIQDSSVAKAYRRITTQLHADEVRFAMLESQTNTALQRLKLAEMGWIGKMVDDVQDGWVAIQNMGVQVPEELAQLWKPQIEKLRSRYSGTTLRKLANAYDWYNQFFKTYATLSLGFSVRNAMSSTFMNYVAGVDTNSIVDGVKAMFALQKHGPIEWVNHLGLDEATKKVYMDAYKIMRSTTGLNVELLSPTISDGWASKILNNRFTRASHAANSIVEDAARFPMALDSLRNGFSFDETVARISKYHFDYGDLSNMDEAMRRIVPFWIWTTRNIPLQITEMWSRPSAYSIYDKITKANPVNSDLILPSYMSESRPMGMGSGGILMPDMPQNRLEQQLAQFTDPTRIVGQMNPLIKVPIETLALNKQAALDIPFSNTQEEAKGIDKAIAALGILAFGEGGGQFKDPETGKMTINPRLQYAFANYIPLLGMVERLAGGALGGKSTLTERQLSSWANWFGIPYKNIGPRQQRAELIRRQFELAKYLKNNSSKLGPKD